MAFLLKVHWSGQPLVGCNNGDCNRFSSGGQWLPIRGCEVHRTSWHSLICSPKIPGTIQSVELMYVNAFQKLGVIWSMGSGSCSPALELTSHDPEVVVLIPSECWVFFYQWCDQMSKTSPFQVPVIKFIIIITIKLPARHKLTNKS